MMFFSLPLVVDEPKSSSIIETSVSSAALFTRRKCFTLPFEVVEPLGYNEVQITI